MINVDDRVNAETWTGVLESPPGAEVRIDGRSYCYFAGTAYFALQGHPSVIQAGCAALQRYGVHSATSRGGYGASPPLLEVEELTKEYFQAEAAFYFITGYWGNNLILSGLRERFEVIFYDEQSHYSLLEAIQLSQCRAYPFQHRNAADLAAKLKQSLQPGERPLVLSDGVFASSGRMAPIDQYLNVLRAIPHSILAIDDAHAIGILGEGLGTFGQWGIPFSRVNRHPDEVTSPATRLYCCATLSKAMGGSGGIIAGSAAWVSHLKSSSRYFNAASSPPAPIAAATAAAMRLVMSDPSIRQRQQNNARQLRSGLSKLRLDVEENIVPFTSLVVQDARHMQNMQSTLRDRGIIIAYARNYSGVGPSGHLRIAVSSAHTPPMIENLLQEIASLI